MILRIRNETPEAYVSRLQTMDIGAEAVGPQAVRLQKPLPVSEIPGFDDGMVSVQDAAAQWAAPLLLKDLPKNAHVLDACAAPGGKTAHMLELDSTLRVTALDSDAQRLDKIRTTLNRLNIEAKLQAVDARRPDLFEDQDDFDAILLDAPCSASGIVRRHPDIRWLRRDTDIAALAQIQKELLDALWPRLKSGGKLLYCTCSIFKDEGQHQIDAFLQRYPNAKLLESPGHALPTQGKLQQTDASTLKNQQADAHDGFFYALIEKSPTPTTLC